MATKEQIKPIYEELQGYYSQATRIRSDIIYEDAVWEQYNMAVDALSEVSGADYGRFKAIPLPEHSESIYGEEVRTPERIGTLGYSSKLSGLINRLHAEFFSDEPSPFADSPDMVISQTQQQYQSIHVQMIMEIQEYLTRSEGQFKEGSKERGFIDKAKGFLKSAASGVTSAAQLMLLLLNVAKECGLNIDDMQRIFGG
jgi:hypothetical protein